MSSSIANAAAIKPLLRDNPHRFVLFPIRYQRIWEMYKKAEASFWTTEEVDLSDDMKHWQSLMANEQHFIKHVLAFFAASNGIMAENLAGDFMKEVQVPEAQCFYSFQIAIKNIHLETYSLLLDTYVKDPIKKAHLFNAIKSVPSVKKKAKWAMRWINKEGLNTFAEHLVRFTTVEGIFFSGSFCSIFWLKKRSLMPSLTFSNELISRNKGLHAEFACLLYSMLMNKLSSNMLKQIVLKAVKIKKEFVMELLPVALIGMNAGLMCQYIEFVTNCLLVALRCKKHYNATNPFPWMELISLEGKTNFFKRQIGEYAKSGVKVLSNTNSTMHVFTTNKEF